jgi:phosphoesterase RecJ-like protein
MTPLSRALEPVVDLIRTADRFLLCSHEIPEGDCLGASLGLYHGLRALGREVHLFNPDEIPRQYRFLPGADCFSTSIPEGRFGGIFVLDCGGLDRLGAAGSSLRGRGPLVNLDHHRTNSRFGDLNVVEPGLSSTGELIYELLGQLEVSIDRAIAEVLFAAISTDTGSFRYANASARTFEVARALVTAGASPCEVATALYENNSLGRLRLLARVLETLSLSPDGRVASVRVTRAMLAETGASLADVEGMVNFPRSLEGVEVAILFRENDGGVGVSLRSKGDVDVSALAVCFGGGGHRNAAGFSWPGTLDEVEPRVLEQVRATLTTSDA